MTHLLLFLAGERENERVMTELPKPGDPDFVAKACAYLQDAIVQAMGPIVIYEGQSLPQIWNMRPKQNKDADMTRDKPSLGDADMLERFAQYYAVNPTWGSLHIVLDDGNVRDSDAEFCRSFALEHGDQEGAELAEYLMKMSKTQRLELPNRIRQV